MNEEWLDRMVCHRYGHAELRFWCPPICDYVTTCGRCGLFQPDDHERYQRRINERLGFEPGPTDADKAVCG